MYPNVHSSTVCNSQVTKAPYTPISRGMDKKMWYVQAMGYYSAVKKKGKSAATWMDLESVTPSKVSQTEEEKYCNGIPYMWSLKGDDTDELTHKTERDSQALRPCLRLPGKMGGRES